ncbi:MAG: hypothetical protein AMJ69_00020 [Gammaproteobacteria bacterium SG8_47]|nr:MAG: hypothetical protein AMJ69_00020 [Gammaproteobacteria bacterium SG8_47]
MRTWTFAFLLGVVCFQQLRELPSLHWAWLMFLIVPASLRLNWPARLGAAAAAGFLWSLLHAYWTLFPALAPELYGRDIVLEGVVVAPPRQGERFVRFDFEILARPAEIPTDALPRRVRLSWYETSQQLVPGERWRLRVRLKPPHGFSNPGGFDYEGWLLRQGIGATGYVRKGAENARLAAARGYALQRLRHRGRQRLAELLQDRPEKGIISALALGLRDDITSHQWQVLSRTGTTHLMAISGLHIGLVAGLAFWLLRWGWSLSARLTQRLAAPKAGAFAALGVALGYAALAGFAVPTQRALVMLVVILGGVVAQRHVRPTQALCAALLAVLLWDPMSALAPGFWLSFAAVAVLFGTALARHAGGGWWQRAGRAQLALAIGLLPLLALFFQQASVVAPLANLVVVPIVGTVVVPLTLAGSVIAPLLPSVGQGLLGLAAWLLGWVLTFLSWLAGFDWASVSLSTASTLGWLVALPGAALALAPRGWPARWLAAPLLAPLLLARHPSPGPGEVWLTTLDVGQGLAAVVHTQRHTLVYDTGPRFSDSFDAGRAVVVPYLRHAGVAEVDTLVVSHGDNDHIGGAESLLAALPVKRVLSAAPDKLSKVTAQPCLAGERWSWDGVEFQILHPRSQERRARENDTSCVLRVGSRYGSVLLTGDIERGAEGELVRAYDEELIADIMTAPHHGSRTSSSAAFVAAVQPEHVVVPAGYANRYGFPHEEVLTRYDASGAMLWNTGLMGALTFRLAEQASRVPTRQRDRARRYWHRL